MRFEMKGVFRKKGAERKFSKEVIAGSERLAREKLFGLLGSEHKLQRRFIRIDEISELREQPKAETPKEPKGQSNAETQEEPRGQPRAKTQKLKE